MENKIKPRIFWVLTAFCAVLTAVLGGCFGGGQIAELKAAYFYDADSSVLIKYPSELEFEPNELLAYDDGKTKAVGYNILDLTLPGRDLYGELYDYKIKLAYAEYGGKLVFTEIPVYYAPCETYALGGSVNSFVAAVNDENAYLVTIDNSGGAAAKKLFGGDVNEFTDKNSPSKLIYAKIIGVSPDGRYILYFSNRDYIKSGPAGSIDIYYYDTETEAEAKIMNFDGKEFLCWETGAPGNFLFRESGYSETGSKVYSDIRRYSIANAAEDIFKNIGEEYRSYEMIGGRYIYAAETLTPENAPKETLLHIFDIYSEEVITASARKYSTIWNVKLSENGEYLGFLGSYINVMGIAIPEIVTLNLETNSITAHYEQNEGVYFVGSFFWLPDNILGVNFQNTNELFKDLCRLHKINHK